MGHSNVFFSRYFRTVLYTAAIVVGVYLPLCAITATAYTGSKSMINFGSMSIYLISAYFGLHLLWLWEFKSLSKKNGGDEWSKQILNLKQLSEYKVVATVWGTLASMVFVLLMVIWIFLMTEDEPGLSGEYRIGSAAQFIGVQGSQKNADDLWHASCIALAPLSVLTTLSFFRLNSMVYYFGSQKP